MSDEAAGIVATARMGTSQWICPQGTTIRIGTDDLHGSRAWEPVMLYNNASRELQVIAESLRRIESFFGNEGGRLEGTAWREAARQCSLDLAKIRARLPHGATGGQPSDGLAARKARPS